MLLRGGLICALVLAGAATTACGDGDEPSAAVEHGSSTEEPGKAAREICEPMIRDAVEFEVGSPLVGAPIPSVEGDTFSCRYEFSDGTLAMSVRDLQRQPRARAAFVDLLRGSDTVERLPGLGDDSFMKPDSTLVLIKDAMVLTIDLTDLPPPAPDRDRSSISAGLGASVMGCWPG